ncbi:MAG: type II secretion system F family protein [candidate division SR1 bacterium]|nr:type II secretion system F family protein [candidate division SR1 bacterium]
MEVNKLGFFEKFVIKKFFAPKLTQKTNFFRLLALAQRSGLGLRDALLSIKKSETNKGLIMIIEDLIDQLTQGSTFSQAMGNHDYFFEEEEIALVQSAETMGNLPEILEEIAKELENSERINGKIRKAMTYPIVLIVFAIVAVTILLIYVIPTIVTMFPNQESLPSLTKFMMGASTFLQKTRYLILIIIIGAIVLYRFLYKSVLTFKIFIDKLMVTLPAVSGVVKTYYMYRFSKLLSQLYSAGVSPILSLKLMGNTFTNFFYRKKVIEIKENLNAGFSFAESMEGSSLFDPILVQIIHVGEDTGNITEVLKKMSDFYRDILQNRIDILMSLIEPILMAMIAVVIGAIVGAIFLPMAELVNVIK